MSDIEQEIVSIIAEEWGANTSLIDVDMSFDTLGIDSLTYLEILARLENRYNIRIHESLLKNAANIKEVIGIVRQELERK